jgi:NhaA family Na+:H+ antiporter
MGDGDAAGKAGRQMASQNANAGGALAFVQHEAAGGVVMIAAAIVALLMQNSFLAPAYDGLLDTPVTVRLGALLLDKPLLLWVNDGLMAVFFLLVGMEIKRELVVGELSSVSQAMLPAIAAAGGMLVPAMIYLGITSGTPGAAPGWAIPSATDIAFAVGVLTLLGPRVPPSLKIFLLALAIIDDLGAIIIIALFYTAKLSPAALALAAVGVAMLIVLNRMGVRRIAPYILTGVFLWVCVLKSGVHATLAGVITGFAIPLAGGDGEKEAPLTRLEHMLHPWVTFMVLPAFAFANAGVSLAGLSLAKIFSPVPLGIAAGLFIGKQVGIFGFTWAAIRLGLGRLPEGASWLQVYGVAILGGIGFTMSLFIGMLAFPDPAMATDIRIGVIVGSLLSALLGVVVLKRSLAPQTKEVNA